MRTTHTQSEHYQTILGPGRKLRRFFASALGTLLLFVALVLPALAGSPPGFVDAVWLANPGSGDWNSGGNWNTETAPVNAGDTATFNTSSQTSLFLSGNVIIDSMTFNAGADSFTISTYFVTEAGVIGNDLTFVGAGIVNNSGVTQTILNGFGSSTSFLNNSTATNATIMNTSSGNSFGTTNFHDASTAANATITNSGGGTTRFFDTSTAGNATISGGFTEFHDASSAANASIANTDGATSFFDTSTAGNATITISGGFNDFHDASTAANAIITNNGGGISFLDNSTAANATIVNGTSGSGFASYTYFDGASTAANATITNSGANSNIAFNGTSTAGDATITNSGVNTYVDFFGSATAGNSTITNSGDGSFAAFESTAANATITNSGLNSFTVFLRNASGGNAALINANSTAFIDISLLTSPGTTVGSIAGNGMFFLGSKNLTVGGNDQDTVFSGVISDGQSVDPGFLDYLNSREINPIQETGGSLTKVGTGTLTLTGNNTYTGATTVNEGTLLIDGSLATGSAVTVNSGGTFGGTGTAAGAVTIANGGILAPGDGGAGTFTLGSLSLGNGSLLNFELGQPGAIGSGFNDLINVTGNLTLDGILNTTALAEFGPGAYRLFNYGGTLIDNTLDIGTLPAGFSASNVIIITGLPNEVDLLVLAGDGAPAVQFWDGPNTTGNGVINGGTGDWRNFTTNWTNASGAANSSWLNGVAVFAGTAGTVSAVEPIYFTGMDFMSSGYQINATGEGSLNLIGSPIIVTENDVTATINAPLMGEGGITKMGSGTLILTGANAYTGATTVGAGSLLVDGSIGTGLTTVNLGGLLGGRGVIGGSVLNGGVVNPGNTLGVLRINGNYTQSAGGSLLIEVAGLGSGQHDLLSIGGTATLAGTLQIVPVNGFNINVGDQVTFLTATVVNGAFDNVQFGFTPTGTLIGTRIVYLADSVLLEGTQGSFEEFGRIVCQIPNHAAVGAALDSAVGDPQAAELITYLNDEPLTRLCQDLDLISPEQLTAVFNIGVSLANVQTANLERRMDDLRAGSSGFNAAGFSMNIRGRAFSEGMAGPTGPEGKSGPPANPTTRDLRWGTFLSGLGEFTSVDSTGTARGFDLSTGGLTLGADYRLLANFAAGLTFGYADTGAELAGGGNLDVNGGKIGAYATAFSGGFYTSAAATGGFNNYDIERNALGGTASGDTEGRSFDGFVAAGYDWKKGNLTFGPTASFQYSYVEFDGFTERGSLAPLTFGDQDANSSRSALGIKASYDCQVGHVLVRPELRAGWQHEFGDTDYSLTARFANGAGNSFTVNSPEIGRDSLLVGAGFAILFNDRISIYAYYDGELLRSNYVSHNVSGGVRVNF